MVKAFADLKGYRLGRLKANVYYPMVLTKILFGTFYSQKKCIDARGSYATENRPSSACYL
jgi:hypothetical protein